MNALQYGPSPEYIGEYLRMSSDEYHGAPGISSSGLRLVGRSLAHYYAAYRDPARPLRQPTDAMRAGTALHCLILEPEAFSARYAVVPADAPQRPTRAMLEAKNPGAESMQRQGYWRLFDQMNAGKETIDAEDHGTVLGYESMQRIQESVWSHPTVRELIEGGAVAESSVFARVPANVEGLESCEDTLVKCRPDWRPSKYNVLIDVKSTEDASVDAFQRAAMNYGYREASWWYPEVMGWAGLAKPEAMFFVAFEKEAPFNVSFFEPSEAFVRKGRDGYKRSVGCVAALNRYAAAMESARVHGDRASFVGYPSEIQVLDVMGWEK